MSETKAPEETHYKLGEISGKIDLVLVQIAANEAANNARHERHEARLDTAEDDIASLKQSRSWVIGAGAAIGALGATVLGALGFKS